MLDLFSTVDFGAAGLSGIGGLIQNLWTDSRQKKSQEFNAQMMREQMAFQEKMANTAWQRGMKDMKEAGLNPILAYQRGPASSPTGTMASTSFTPASDFITPALHSGVQVSKVSQELENMRQTNRNLGATNALIHEQTRNTAANSAKTVAETRNTNEIWQQLKAEAAKARTDEEFYNSPAGRIMRLIGTGGKEAGNALTPVNTIMRRWP